MDPFGDHWDDALIILCGGWKGLFSCRNHAKNHSYQIILALDLRVLKFNKSFNLNLFRLEQ